MLARTAPRTFRHPLRGASVTLVQGSDHAGRTVVEVELCPAGREAPQRHLTRDQRVDVLRGTLTVELDGIAVRVDAGGGLVVPAGRTRVLSNDTLEDVVLRITMDGHRGYERALAVVGGLAADGLVAENGLPLNPYHLALVLEWSDVRPVGLRDGADQPLAMLARAARAKGLAAELLERYVS